MKIAVITGASSGMGREFVLKLDAQKNFDEIWVIARRLERLQALGGETKAKIRPISLDLTKEESIEEYGRLLAEEKPEVTVLVNAGGFGKFAATEDVPLEEYYSMIKLNDMALVGMTYKTLPYMKSGAEIYQLGSLSAFQPVPYINVYAASKAFVLSFSRGLAAELSPRGIAVMAVCPGWVKTEFFDRAVSDDSVISYYNKYFTAEQVVIRALSDMKKRKTVSVCGASVRLQVFAVKHFPIDFVMKTWCNQQKKPWVKLGKSKD